MKKSILKLFTAILIAHLMSCGNAQDHSNSNKTDTTSPSTVLKSRIRFRVKSPLVCGLIKMQKPSLIITYPSLRMAN